MTVMIGFRIWKGKPNCRIKKLLVTENTEKKLNKSQRHHPHPSLPLPEGRVRVGGKNSPEVMFTVTIQNPFFLGRSLDGTHFFPFFCDYRVYSMSCG